jgi:hypothetical protein
MGGKLGSSKESPDIPHSSILALKASFSKSGNPTVSFLIILIFSGMSIGFE